MALIKCVECGRKISDKAESCPKCGIPLENMPEQPTVNKKSKKGIMVDYRIVGILVILIISILIVTRIVMP